MREEDLKFARRFDRMDQTIKSSYWYSFTRGLHPRHQKLVPRAFKTIVSSGRLALWRKWEASRLERKYGLLEVAVDASEDFVPLSFKKSDVHIQFIMLGILLVSSVVAFALECFVHYRAQK